MQVWHTAERLSTLCVFVCTAVASNKSVDSQELIHSDPWTGTKNERTMPVACQYWLSATFSVSQHPMATTGHHSNWKNKRNWFPKKKEINQRTETFSIWFQCQSEWPLSNRLKWVRHFWTDSCPRLNNLTATRDYIQTCVCVCMFV